MATQSKKILVVVGATGNQGSSVTETFLASGEWHVRCITRNPESTAAKKLGSLGAELVQGDLSDRDSLVKGFESAQALFANTDFWSTYFDPTTAAKAEAAQQSLGKYAFDVEVTHGKNIADVAASVPALERFVFSALPPLDKGFSGEISNCYHWDSKATIIDYIQKSHPDLDAKMSTIYLSAYTTNAFIIPRWDRRSSSYKIMVPMRPEAVLPVINPQKSTGPLVQALIESEAPKTHLYAYDTGSKLSMGQITDLWSTVMGTKIEFETTSVDYMHEEFDLPREILAGPVLVDKYHYMHGVDGYIEPPQLKSKVKTTPYEDWLRGHWQDILPPKRDSKA